MARVDGVRAVQAQAARHVDERHRDTRTRDEDARDRHADAAQRSDRPREPGKGSAVDAYA